MCNMSIVKRNVQYVECVSWKEVCDTCIAYGEKPICILDGSTLGSCFTNDTLSTLSPLFFLSYTVKNSSEMRM
jgi:hypothetical protein